MSSALRGYIAPDLEETNLENNMNNMLMKKIISMIKKEKSI